MQGTRVSMGPMAFTSQDKGLRWERWGEYGREFKIFPYGGRKRRGNVPVSGQEVHCPCPLKCSGCSEASLRDTTSHGVGAVAMGGEGWSTCGLTCLGQRVHGVAGCRRWGRSIASGAVGGPRGQVSVWIGHGLQQHRAARTTGL